MPQPGINIGGIFFNYTCIVYAVGSMCRNLVAQITQDDRES